MSVFHEQDGVTLLSIHIDLSADYLRLARWRIFESGHWSKTSERTTNRAQLAPGFEPPEKKPRKKAAKP